MPRELAYDFEASLEHGQPVSALEIFLGDEAGSVLRVATSDFSLSSPTRVFLGKLECEGLRMGVSKATDGFNFTIDNISLVLGQTLIHTPNALDGTFAVFGFYFKNLRTGDSWYDEKIAGEIVRAEIDGEKISCRFVSDLDAAKYAGETIASVFPDVTVVQPGLPQPSSNDLVNYYPDGYIGRDISLLTDDPMYGRHYFPLELSV